MKKMTLIVSAALMALASYAENKNVAPFEGVNVNVPARVRFVYGETYSVDIQAADRYVAAAIDCTVKNGTLKIRSNAENDELTDVCIIIASPKEPTLTVGRNMEVNETTRTLSDAALES